MQSILRRQGLASWLATALGPSRVTGFDFAGRGRKARLLSAALIAEFDRLLRAGDLLLGAARSEIIPAPDPLDHLQF